MSKKVILFVLIILFVFVGIRTGTYFILKEKKASKPLVTKKETNVIEGYNYTLDNLDTDLYKQLFQELKTNLTSDDVSLEEYAKSIAKMFIVDFYTLDSKINKYDVGGVEFLIPKYKDNFVTNATDTVYKYVEDNSDLKRNQVLPVVSNVDVSEIEETKFKITEEDKEYDAYKVKLNWEYVSDLDYDTDCELMIIKDNGILYIVEKN